MKTLSIDIETYSDVPLPKTGVYRYCESPNFEILLFAYSVDNGPVQVVDLACGEMIPPDVKNALEDESVIKWAFNASFERICLSRFLGYPTGEYLDPESWRCSMIWAATMGLPLSLEGVGAVLGLEKQKLAEGKDLIKYFCQPCAPTKSNGGRTRNLPFHAPDKWAMFKKYNIRDVETEMGIQQKLHRFPVPDFVWDEYHLDQEINDRGVRLDMELVKQAIEMDDKSREELTAAIKDITHLENPNSVLQMKQWLSEHGVETDSLDKKAVAELLKDAPEELAEVLTLRQQLAKSSVRKYQARCLSSMLSHETFCSKFSSIGLKNFTVCIFVILNTYIPHINWKLIFTYVFIITDHKALSTSFLGFKDTVLGSSHFLMPRLNLCGLSFLAASYTFILLFIIFADNPACLELGVTKFNPL